MREPHLVECLRGYVHECARVHARVHECVRRQQYMHPKITRKASQKTSKTSNVRPKLKHPEKGAQKTRRISDIYECKPYGRKKFRAAPSKTRTTLSSKARWPGMTSPPNLPNCFRDRAATCNFPGHLLVEGLSDY